MTNMVDYQVPLPIQEAWDRTHSFWQMQTTKTKIVQDELNIENGKALMSVDQSASFTSYGQIFSMEFTSAGENVTNVHVVVSLHWGSGLQWLKVNTILKKWAVVVGTTHKNFATGGIIASIIVLAIAIVFLVLLIAFNPFLFRLFVP